MLSGLEGRRDKTLRAWSYQSAGAAADEYGLACDSVARASQHLQGRYSASDPDSEKYVLFAESFSQYHFVIPSFQLKISHNKNTVKICSAWRT
jgi:hypothetical protein